MPTPALPFRRFFFSKNLIDPRTLKTTTQVLFFVAAIWCLLFYFWRFRIAFAAVVLKTTASVVERYPAMVGFSFIKLVILVLWGVAWTVGFLNLTGPSPPCCVASVRWGRGWWLRGGGWLWASVVGTCGRMAPCLCVFVCLCVCVYTPASPPPLFTRL